MKNTKCHIQNRTRLTNYSRRSRSFSLPQAKRKSKQGSKQYNGQNWSCPSSHKTLTDQRETSLAQKRNRVITTDLDLDTSKSPLTPRHGTSPVKVRDRTLVRTQSPLPFLKAPVPGSSPGRPSSCSQGCEDGFLLTTERKPKPTLRNTSSPEVSKSKLSPSNPIGP